jgi:hypothetical protein
MKLTTDIKPRKDGTVIARASERAYTFADEGGMLVAEVHEDDIGFLLDTGNFYPADEADIEAGIAAVVEQQEGEGKADIESAPVKTGKKKAK